MSGRYRSFLHRNSSRTSPCGIYFHWFAAKTNNLPRIDLHKGIGSTVKHQAKWATLVLLLISCQLTYAQINSSTLVVFQLVDGKFIVAADSRGILRGNPRDTDCKIAAFRHKVIFASSGNGASIPDAREIAEGWVPWDAAQEARTVVSFTNFSRQRNAEILVNAIADAWGVKMKHIWEIAYSRHPDAVKQTAEQGNGGLTNGLFAIVVNGTIAAAGRAVTIQNGAISVSIPMNVEMCTKLPCGMGLTNTFAKYANEAWNISPTDKAIKLVDLASIHEQPTDTGIIPVGGPTDALELWKNGSIHWIQRKCNCPKNQN